MTPELNEETRLYLDYLKARIDARVRTRELDLKKRELDAKLDETWWSRLSSPLIIAILTGILTVAGGGIATLLQNRANLALERSKFESQLIIKAIETSDQEVAAKNLDFLVRMGLIRDTTGLIASFVEKPQDAPVLPTSVPSECTFDSSRVAGANARRLAELSPDAATAARGLIAKSSGDGIPLLITSAYRSPAEQESLYARGRTKPGPRVTATRVSIHSSRLAFDVVPLDQCGKADWGAMPATWTRVATLAKGLGLKWGGDQRFPDQPHFELPNPEP